MTIIIILVIIFIVLPRVLFFLLKRKVRKQAEAFYNAMNGAREQQPQPQRRKPGWSEPVAVRKKIDKDTGEYVAFEEVSVATQTTETSTDAAGSTYTRTTTTVVTEQQIVDVDWEDLN